MDLASCLWCPFDRSGEPDVVQCILEPGDLLAQVLELPLHPSIKVVATPLFRLLGRFWRILGYMGSLGLANARVRVTSTTTLMKDFDVSAVHAQGAFDLSHVSAARQTRRTPPVLRHPMPHGDVVSC